LKNHTSTAAVAAKTPVEVVTGKKPDLAKLPEWGCRVWVHTKNNSKLDPRAVKGKWIGYDEQSKGSWIYWPDKRSVTVKQSVIFSEPMVVADDFEGEDKDNVSIKNSSLPPPPPPWKTPPSKPIPIPTTPRPQRVHKPS